MGGLAIQKLALVGNPVALRIMDAFNPDQPRDERGMWSADGGTSAASESEHLMASRAHAGVASEALAAGDRTAYKAHWNASRAHEAAAQEHWAAGTFKNSDFQQARLERAKLASEKARSASRAANSAGRESVRATQKEMPAVRETPSRELAVSQKVPAGNQRHEPGHDPNRVTQRDMPVVEGGRSILPPGRTEAEQRVREGKTLDRQYMSMLREAHAARTEREMPAVRNPQFKPARETAESRRIGKEVDAGIDRFNAGHTRQSRAEAASAAAGRWASKALETAAKRKGRK